MGFIRIDVAGSFQQYDDLNPPAAPDFTALKHGHAICVAEAIEWLSSTLMPLAVANDHRLHDEGHTPPQGWPSGR